MSGDIVGKSTQTRNTKIDVKHRLCCKVVMFMLSAGRVSGRSVCETEDYWKEIGYMLPMTLAAVTQVPVLHQSDALDSIETHPWIACPP